MEGDHEWEKCKENIIPLKSGRRVGEVLAALNKDTAHANKMIEDFEMQLRMLQDEELLEKWSEYINWTQQHYISSNQEALNLMKRCVKHFKNKIEVRTHDKFIKIWIKISEMTIEREDIFRHMFDQEIGTSSAILYKEWAIHHENSGNMQRAEDILELGINRNAEPVEEIKLLRRQFEWRKIKRKMAKTSSDEEDNVGEVLVKPAEAEGRVPLNKLSSTKSGKVNSKRERVKLQDITSGRGGLASSSSSSTSSNRKCSSASVFEILSDEKVVKKDSVLPSFSSATAKSKKLPFYDNKENTKATERMVNAKIKPTKPTPMMSSSSKPSFFIYKDDNTAADVTVGSDAGGNDVHAPVTITSRKPLNSITSQIEDCNDMLQDLEQEDGDAKHVCVYPKDKVYMGNNEVSPEELRAQMPKYKNLHRQQENT